MEWHAHTQKLGIPRQGTTRPGLLNGRIFSKKSYLNRHTPQN